MVAVSVVAFTYVTLYKLNPPIDALMPGEKLLPVMVTLMPPFISLLLGEMLLSVGGAR